MDLVLILLCSFALGLLTGSMLAIAMAYENDQRSKRK